MHETASTFGRDRTNNKSLNVFVGHIEKLLFCVSDYRKINGIDYVMATVRFWRAGSGA
jgi:hypothetical protein